MRKCPLCGGSAGNPAFPHQTYWNNKNYAYMSCPECKTVFVDPIPDDHDFALMYSKQNYHDIHYDTLELNNYCHSIKLALPVLKNKNSLLDYGCGNGAFLIAAKQAGFSCVGVEYEESAKQNAIQNSGVSVYDFKSLKETGKKFDIIHLGDVLEHLPNPYEVMVDLQNLLEPEGVFFIEGPLETNPSIVYWAAIYFRRLNQVLGKSIPIGTNTPTHLFMTNEQAQKRFFTHRLSYHCLYFTINETGWPYFQNKLPMFNWKLPILIKQAIGFFAIVASRLFPKLGNRFLAIFQP